jgi:hypothetical protein
MACWTCGLASSAEPRQHVTVDFSKPSGRIKPLHGVCNGPYAYGENAKLEGYHTEAGFPWTRLHDVHWPYSDAVDVSTIFPIFDADVDDPNNYTFAKTDDYLAAIIKNRSQIVYRLGESIEPWTRYHNHPPKNYQKWAKVCVNIIRHYNEGWAKGFRHNIRYWEIWNEPEAGFMWTGTRQQYLDLYEVAAKAIKAHDSALRVGGPAATNAHSDLVKPMLAFCRDRKLPLDFFSWHAYYGEPKYLAADAAVVRKLLDEYGFRQTESHLNEWRYLTTWSGLRPSEPRQYTGVPEWFARSCRAEGAAFCADVLLRLQDQPIDVLNFYSADTSPWSMFGQFGIPTKAYYVFKGFQQFSKCPNRVSCEGWSPGGPVPICAGMSDDRQAAALMASNFKSEPRELAVTLRNLPWKGIARVEIDRVDATHDLEQTEVKTVKADDAVFQLQLPANSVCLVRVKRTARE